MPAPKKDALPAQLRQLMKHKGAFTESRTASYPALRRLSIVQWIQRVHPDNPEPIRQALFSAAVSLEGVQGNLGLPNSDIAVAALGLGPWADRGLVLIPRLRELGKGWGIQESTVRGYQQDVAELLARRLRKLKPEDLVPLDASTDPSEPRETFADIYWKYSGRIVTRHHARRTVRAGSAALDRFRTFITYPNDPGDNVVRVQSDRNCFDGVSKYLRTGQYELTLRLPTTPPGEETNFEYDVYFDTDVADRPYLRHRTRMPAARATVGIQFDVADMPQYVNPFQGEDLEFEPPEGTTDESVRVSESGYVTHVFDQKVGTLFGFGWSWPDT